MGVSLLSGAPVVPVPRHAALRSWLPWPVVLAMTAITSAMIGVQWDIAWHRSIGRDTLWSPPHLAIYLGGILAGLSAAHAILGTTFGGDLVARASSVRVWGFRGPLGAFVSAWGGIAMIASAPFDDWWHDAYGLDVKILSPPHTVLALGIFAICCGALLTLLGHLNRADADDDDAGRRRRLRVAAVYTAGLVLVLVMTFVLELTHLVQMHTPRFYRVVGLMAPAVMVGLGRASGLRFGATAVAGVYTGVLLLLLWIFPLVPAVPRLGPVYNPVTHLIPQGFPLLLMVPALAVDLLAPRLVARPAWLAALGLGLAFALSYGVAQWLFADFLMSPAARNAVFGSGYASYNARPEWAVRRFVFVGVERTLSGFVPGAALAVVGPGGPPPRLGLFAAGAIARLRR